MLGECLVALSCRFFMRGFPQFAEPILWRIDIICFRSSRVTNKGYNVLTLRTYAMNKTYSLRNTRIGNSNGFRLPAEFYRDHPQFADANGWIEVIADNTAVIRIEPPEIDDEESDDDLMMRLFLDFAIEQSLKNKDLTPYTAEMSAVAIALIDGVELDDE
jgi:antitoxin PrlF